MINVFSEIGILKEILLHRPGAEVENLTPETKDRLLFDDIPYLKVAEAEHDAFAKVLKESGAKVLYLEQLMAETLEQSSEIKTEFLHQFLKEAKFDKGYLYDAIFDFLNTFKEKELVNKIIAGIRREDIKTAKSSLAILANLENPFYCDPMPNLMFTRDNFASMGNGITLNTMYSTTRNRECIFAEYIFKHHPDFKNTPFYYNRFENSHIEGGDELILSETTLAIGISQRTQATSIEKLAHRLFNTDTSFRKIVAFKIPEKRAFMHLDTVFTQIDIDKFTIHPEAEAALEVFTLTPNGKGLNIDLEKNTLQHILSDALKIDAKLIKCGGGDPIAAAREQWNDGSNTLAIAPGEVVVYSRNYITNQILQDSGIKIHEIPSSELSRGRGGPRCMSMPIKRLNFSN